MVSIGTVFGLLLAGGAALVGYGLYQNRGAIGSALARGTEVNITNPIGDWFESLFRNNENNGEGDNNDNQEQPPIIPPDPNNTFIPCSNNPADYRTWCNGYTPPPDQDFLPPAPEPAPPINPPGPVAPEPAPEPDVEPDRGSRPSPNPIDRPAPDVFIPPGPTPPELSYYYLDWIGPRDDQQLLLNQDQLAQFENDPGIRGVYDLGTQRPLGAAAFRLFGESRGAYGV